jgi:hypothetical protein
MEAKERREDDRGDVAQPSPPHGPLIRRASWMSFCMIVTRFAWIAHKLLMKDMNPQLCQFDE